MPSKVNLRLADGSALVVTAPPDCETIKDAFLQEWCAEVLNPALVLPTSDFSSSQNPTYLAVLAQGLLANDGSVCDDKAVAHWIAVTGHVKDGAMACHESFSALAAAGEFSVSDPANGETITISLK